MYIEASSPQSSGDVARLLSPLYPPNLSKRCFLLWYHMYGPATGVGTLSIGIKMFDSPRIRPELFVEGNQGTQWHRVDIYIEELNKPFQIVISATRRHSYASDIAIDDVRLYDCDAERTINATGTPGLNYTTPAIIERSTNTTYSTSYESVTNITVDEISTPPHHTVSNVYNTTQIMNSTMHGNITTLSTYSSTLSASSSPRSMLTSFYWQNSESHFINYSDKEILESCNFERNNLCGWTQDNLDDFDWKRHSGKTQSSDTGPQFDHTFEPGHYLYIEASSPRNPGDVARLFSPVYPASFSKSCLSLYYHMYGPSVNDVGSLSIGLKVGGDSEDVISLFHLKGSQENRWLRAETFIDELTQPFQIVISATRGNTYSSDISIDDLNLTRCDQIKCSFETTSLCGWMQDKTDDFDWTRHSGPTKSSGTGPKSDRTLGQKSIHNGYYLYIEASSPRKLGDEARLLSPVHPENMSTRCLSFSYHMYGKRYIVGKLSVGIKLKDSNHTTVLFSVNGNHGSKWLDANVRIGETDQPFQIVISAKRGSSYESDIAIDDLLLSTCKPAGKQTLDFCDFESNLLCGWTQDKTDKFDWTRNSGSTKTSNTGPKYDHTKGLVKSGHYMYIEVSSPRKPGDLARLISPMYDGNMSQNCFALWYHMFGTGKGAVGNFSIGLKFENSKTIYSIFSIRGNQGNDWHKAEIFIEKYDRPFQIIISATKGLTYAGDISIDDFELYKCPNKSQLSTNKTIQVISRRQTIRSSRSFTSGRFTSSRLRNTTIFVRQPSTASGKFSNRTQRTSHRRGRTSSRPRVTTVSTPNVTKAELNLMEMCTFETLSFCGWEQDKFDDFDWTRFKGKTASSKTGPSHDHTHGSSGFYMYIESSRPRKPGDVARLLSPVYPANFSESCLSVWYHMYGPGSGQKDVGSLSIRVKGSDSENNHDSFFKSGNQGFKWHRADIYIEKKTAPFQIIISATRGRTYSSDIAIDDINLRKCDNDVCTFENKISKCLWKQDQTDDFDWTRHKGSTASSGTGPKFDRTLGKGHYMYIESSSPRKRGDVARLLSPMYPANYSKRCLFFWYHMYGLNDTVGSLSVGVKLQNSKTITSLYVKRGNQGEKWLDALVEIGKTDRPFQIVISATRGRTYSSDIAIDDVHLTQCMDMGGPGALDSCKFENKCHWTQDKTDNFDWTRHFGKTATTNTGPLYDHTVGQQGHYLYIEASDPRRPGDLARLLSPMYPANMSASCFSLWYHMYGTGTNSVGNFSIDLKMADNQKRSMFFLSGNQGNKWREAYFFIDKLNRPFQIIISATRGRSYEGDISIDDIHLRRCDTKRTRYSTKVIQTSTIMSSNTSKLRVTYITFPLVKDTKSTTVRRFSSPHRTNTAYQNKTKFISKPRTSRGSGRFSTSATTTSHKYFTKRSSTKHTFTSRLQSISTGRKTSAGKIPPMISTAGRNIYSTTKNRKFETSARKVSDKTSTKRSKPPTEASKTYKSRPTTRVEYPSKVSVITASIKSSLKAIDKSVKPYTLQYWTKTPTLDNGAISTQYSTTFVSASRKRAYKWIPITIGVGCVVLLICIIVCSYLVYKRYQLNKRNRENSYEEVKMMDAVSNLSVESEGYDNLRPYKFNEF